MRCAGRSACCRCVDWRDTAVALRRVDLCMDLYTRPDCLRDTLECRIARLDQRLGRDLGCDLRGILCAYYAGVHKKGGRHSLMVTRSEFRLQGRAPAEVVYVYQELVGSVPRVPTAVWRTHSWYFARCCTKSSVSLPKNPMHMHVGTALLELYTLILLKWYCAASFLSIYVIP
jgi:hypothetical protein